MTVPQQPLRNSSGGPFDEKIGTPLDEGMRLLQQGDAQGAVALLERAVQTSPNNPRAHQYLGIARTQVGDPARGIEALQSAARLLPQDAVIAYNLGVAMVQARRNDEARYVLERALFLDPGHAKARAALANLMGSGASPEPGPAATIPPGAAVVTSPGTIPPPLSTSPLSGPGGLAPVASVVATTPPPASPAPTASAMPTLSPVGDMGLSPVGGGLAPVGGGLAPVGGGNAVPGLAPVGGPGGASAPPPQPIAPPSFDPPSFGPPASFGARAGIGSREPTHAERMKQGALWGAIYGQMWTALNTGMAFLFNVMAARSEEAGTGLLVTLGISVILALNFAFVGSMIGLVVGALGADEDQGAWVATGVGLLLFGINFLIGQYGGAGFGLLLGGPMFGYIGRMVGRLTAEKAHQRVDL